jgi:outer membrane biosynthesis protein TonB
MTTRFAPPDRARPRWQILLAPMLLASLGLHGLLLMLPVGPSDVVIPPPDPEQDSVAITRVPPAGIPEAAATPTSAAAPATVGTAAALAQPQPVLQNTPAPRPAQTTPAPSRPRAGAARPAAPTNNVAQPSASAASTPPADSVTSSAPPSAPASSQPLFEGDLGDRLRTYVAGLNLPAERVEQLRAAILQRVTYTAEATTAAAFDQNLSQWQSTIRADTGLTTLTPEPAPTELDVTYYQRACLSESPGPVQAGVLVSPSGSTRSQPVVLRSSGYGAVDDHALRAVTTHQFPPSSEARAYTVTVDTELRGQADCLTVDALAQEASATGT